MPLRQVQKAVGRLLNRLETVLKVPKLCTRSLGVGLSVTKSLVRDAPDLVRDIGELAGPHELLRVAETGVILAQHAARVGWRGAVGREEITSAAASELRQAFEVLGPTYVKLGQIIASSPIFPETLAEEFRSCLDNASPVSYRDIREVIIDELGTTPELAFAYFDPEPLAAASIAQVHAARLHDGSEVVVKVQRPGIKERLRADLAILTFAARMLERSSDSAWMANPVAVLEDFAATLNEELDFVTEAESMERFENNLREFGRNEGVRVPKVHWNKTTRRVLTMERVQGCRIDDVAALTERGVDTREALVSICRAWMEGAFEHGFVHGDLHAGNLMVDTDGSVVFLDFGIMGRLDQATRHLLGGAMVPLIVNSDFREMAKVVYRLGGSKDVDQLPGIEEVAQEIAAVIDPVLAAPLAELSLGQIIVDVIRVGSQYQLRFPREVVLLAKAALYVDRFSRLMAPGWTMLSDPELVWFLTGGDRPKLHLIESA